MGCAETAEEPGSPDYFVPMDPPAAQYLIDAACRLDDKSVLVEGTEAVLLQNTSRQPISVIALEWSTNPTHTLDVSVQGTKLEKFGPKPADRRLYFFVLPEAVLPNRSVTLDIDFSIGLKARSSGDIYLQAWYPKLWWDDLPTRDAFSVKLDAPSDYEIASSGRLNEATGYYENPGVTTTFGFWLSKNVLVEEREASGVLVRALFTEEGRECAMLCLDTAVDVIPFFKQYHGVFPFESLTIIPGASRPMGGYPYASALVVIHGQQAFDKRPPLHWKWITAHEIGHQYWGEYIMSSDNPDDYTESWLMIGMGIFADRLYTEARNLDDDKHESFFNRFKSGLTEYHDTTADAPESLKAQQKYDRNNVLIHGKGYAIVSALRQTLGDEMFHRIYRRCVRDYGGKRMGYRDLMAVAEGESGESLHWFFEQWVRSPRYLCYQITAQDSRHEVDGFVTTLTVERMGDSIAMPVDVQAVFEDGTEQISRISRFADRTDLVFRSQAKLKEAILDPHHRLAMLPKPLPVLPAELPDRVRKLPYNGSWEEGLKLYKISVENEVPDYNIWFKLGMVVFEGGYLDEALDCFRRLLDLDSPADYDFMALTWIANICDARGQREEAVKYYRQALKISPEGAWRHDQFRIESSREWIEKRLHEPYDWSTIIKK
jgi:hypothetical protein